MCLPLGTRYSRASSGWADRRADGRDDDLALALGVLAHRDLAVDLADDGVILRLAGFEELGDAGQTARDVLHLGGVARDLGDDLAGVDEVALLRDDVGADRQEVAGVEIVGARDLRGLARLRVLDRDARTKIGGARLDDDLAGEAGDLVELLGDGDALDEVAELHLPPTSVRIGMANGSHSARSCPPFDLVALGDAELGAVNEAVVLALATGVVHHHQLAVAIHDDLPCRRVAWRERRCAAGRSPRCALRASSARSCRAPRRRRCGTCAS